VDVYWYLSRYGDTRYRDSVDNTVEENASVFPLI